MSNQKKSSQAAEQKKTGTGGQFGPIVNGEATTPADLGAGPSVVNQVVTDYAADFSARYPEAKTRDRFSSFHSPEDAVLSNVSALQAWEDGSGRESYALVARLNHAVSLHGSTTPAGETYARAATELEEALLDAGIDPTISNLVPEDRFDGYRVTKVHERMGHEGMSFDCVLTRNGKEVGEVSNDGNGGQDMSHFKDRDEKDRFLSRSMLLTDTDFEPESFVVADMLGAAELNRRKSIPFLMGDDDFKKDGACKLYPIPKGQSREDCLKDIAKAYTGTGENVRLWDRDKCDFISVD